MSSLRWPTYTTEPNTESKAVGSAVEKMVAAGIAKSAANQRQLQEARAVEARRLRQESIDAATAMPPDAFNTFPPEKKA